MSVSALGAQNKPIKVKVFIAGMFEIGANQGDKPGEFQHWFERYFIDAQSMDVAGALTPVFCNISGVCGSVLGLSLIHI